jgi:2-keto-4-pentenoate hydratase/2-oxohepta-3-ene-1,7-dioic acid hydratase in catechol pathway
LLVSNGGKLSPEGAGRSLSGATVLAPIDQPRRNIYCVGKNYSEHAAEFQKSGFDSSAKDGEHAPEAPVVFTKPASTVIGPGEQIPSTTVLKNKALFACLQAHCEESDGNPFEKIRGVCVPDGPVAWAR